MTNDEMTECVGFVQRGATAILTTVGSQKGNNAANLRRLAGLLYSNAEAYLIAGTVVSAVKAALDEARNCNASVQTMARVRLQALSETPLALPGTMIKNMFIRMSLAQEARIAVNMTFRSVDDAQLVADFMTEGFTEAAEVAADEMDSASYRAIIGLQGDLAFFFASQARQLPRVLTYETPQRRTSLALSQRLYMNGKRADELRDQNRVVHPAFMPKTGKALAV